MSADCAWAFLGTELNKNGAVGAVRAIYGGRSILAILSTKIDLKINSKTVIESARPYLPPEESIEGI